MCLRREMGHLSNDKAPESFNMTLHTWNKYTFHMSNNIYEWSIGVTDDSSAEKFSLAGLKFCRDALSILFYCSSWASPEDLIHLLDSVF